MSHSPEPWMHAPDYDENDGDVILASNDANVAIVLSSPIFADAQNEKYPREVVIANAERIVACVNACAGLSTEQLEALEQGGVNELVRCLRDAASFLKPMPRDTFDTVSVVKHITRRAIDLLKKIGVKRLLEEDYTESEATK